MAARAIWKGRLRLDELDVPVKIYSAVEDRNIHFRLLHRKDGVRLKQRMVNPETGDTVPYQEARRGVEVDSGRFVLLSEEELEELEPTPSRDMEIAYFVAPELINHAWYVRPYWLGPDDSAQPYAELVAALARTDREAVVQWVMRKKEYRGALRERGGRLLLITLRSADEVIAASDLPRPQGAAVREEERKMASMIVQSLADEFRPEDYEDEYRERVMALIEAKRTGGVVEAEEFAPPATDEEKLDQQLKESLESIAA